MNVRPRAQSLHTARRAAENEFRLAGPRGSTWPRVAAPVIPAEMLALETVVEVSVASVENEHE